VAMSRPRYSTWLMASIQDGQHFVKAISGPTPGIRVWFFSMPGGLAFCELQTRFAIVWYPLLPGRKSRCQMWWLLAWSCITWSLRVSRSMILNHGNGRVLLRMVVTRCQLHLLPSSPYVKKSKIQWLIVNSKTIWWNIYVCSKKMRSFKCFKLWFKTCKINYYLPASFRFPHLWFSQPLW
jgi:hypothetical protein